MNDPEQSPARLQFIDGGNGRFYDSTRGVQSRFRMRITNTSFNRVCGALAANIRYELHPRLYLPGTTNEVARDNCIGPGEIFEAELALTPSSDLALGQSADVGITFVESRFFVVSSKSANPSRSDRNVEKRWYENGSAHDAPLGSDFIRVKLR